jgi:hypothetical protein
VASPDPILRSESKPEHRLSSVCLNDSGASPEARVRTLLVVGAADSHRLRWHRFQEALIKVRLKKAFAPLPLGGAGGRGAATAKRSNLPVCAGFQPARDLFWGSTRSSTPPLTPPRGRGIYLIRASLSMFSLTLRARASALPVPKIIQWELKF